MLKDTHKGRATTLSKTLLTAGLLGAAALTTLGAGSAKAVTQLDCTFGSFSGGSLPKCSDVFFSPTAGWTLGDKTLTNLAFSPENPPSGIFSFLQINDLMYATNVDFNPVIPLPFIGSYSYDLSASVGNYFESVELDVDHQGTGQSTVNKTVENGNPIPLVLTSNSGASVGPVPLSGTSITVTDDWTIGATDVTISSISNTFTQVPAPLPLLGVGAVFGSIRKLRKFSSQLKTFSMG